MMILITRPQAEAAKLELLLNNLGYQTHVDSLSKFVISKIKINLRQKGIILFSSVRASKIFLNNYRGSKNIPILIIGNSSYKEFKKAGFKKILYKANDGNELLRFLNRKHQFLKINFSLKIVYYTGNINNQIFMQNLLKSDYKIEKKVLYKTIYKKSLNPRTIQLINEKKIIICLIYSKQNALKFCELLNNSNLKKKSQKISFIVLSQNISNALRENGYKNVRHPRVPTQARLINTIRNSKLL